MSLHRSYWDLLYEAGGGGLASQWIKLILSQKSVLQLFLLSLVLVSGPIYYTLTEVSTQAPC